MSELLVWPALLAYGEALVAYVRELRAPGAALAATWGVRLGWLAQTALLLGQLVNADGFPWASWAGSLNLFVWLVVGAYLIWGCSSRYRLLGLLVMPVAVALLAAAWAGGGTVVGVDEPGGVVLGVHAGLMLAGFAALTLAAVASALYLWQERRLKRREAGVLRPRVPPLDALDRIAGRTVAAALALLTVGIAFGLAVLDAGDFDAAMALTLATWAWYAALVLLRLEGGWRGRRSAAAALAGFALVVAVLPITHFA